MVTVVDERVAKEAINGETGHHAYTEQVKRLLPQHRSQQATNKKSRELPSIPQTSLRIIATSTQIDNDSSAIIIVLLPSLRMTIVTGFFLFFLAAQHERPLDVLDMMTRQAHNNNPFSLVPMEHLWRDAKTLAKQIQRFALRLQGPSTNGALAARQTRESRTPHLVFFHCPHKYTFTPTLRLIRVSKRML